MCICILALFIRLAKRMRRVILSSVACLTLRYFLHYLINGMIFEKKKLLNKKSMFFSLQVLSETFLILRTIRRDIVMNVHRSSGKVSVSLVRF